MKVTEGNGTKSSPKAIFMHKAYSNTVMVSAVGRHLTS